MLPEVCGRIIRIHRTSRRRLLGRGRDGAWLLRRILGTGGGGSSQKLEQAECIHNDTYREKQDKHQHPWDPRYCPVPVAIPATITTATATATVACWRRLPADTTVSEIISSSSSSSILRHGSVSVRSFLDSPWLGLLYVNHRSVHRRRNESRINRRSQQSYF